MCADNPRIRIAEDIRGKLLIVVIKLLPQIPFVKQVPVLLLATAAAVCLANVWEHLQTVTVTGCVTSSWTAVRMQGLYAVDQHLIARHQVNSPNKHCVNLL